MTSAILISFYGLSTLAALLGAGVTKSKQESRILSLAMALCFALLLSCRDLSFGEDTQVYLDYFSTYSNFSSIFTSSFSWKGDYVFFFLGWLIKQFTTSGYAYIVLMTLMCIIGYWYAVNKLFKDGKQVLIAMFLFMVTSTSIFLYANVLRQGLATTMVLIATSLFLEKRTRLATAVLLLSVFAHKSTVIFFLYFPLAHLFRRWNPSYLLIAGISALALGGLNILDFFLNVSLPFMGDKLSVYNEANYSPIVIYAKLAVLLVGGVYFIATNKFSTCHKFDGILKLYMVSVVSLCLFSAEPKVAARFLLYSASLMPILFAFSVYSFKQKGLAVFALLFAGLAYGMLISFHPSIQSTLIY